MTTTIIIIKIVKCSSYYDNLIIEKNGVIKCEPRTLNSYGELFVPFKRRLKITIDGILLHYFIRELTISPIYRNVFIDHLYNELCINVTVIKMHLVPPSREIVDYDWNDKLAYLVRERCELEHTLSWLSTLGGAFSALGDYFIGCAEVAGKISINQLQLAFRLNDPNVVSRCKLFVSLSLIQKKRFKLAQTIIQEEYYKALNSIVKDVKLLNMCKGIWCKLKYEHSICKTQKHKIN